MAATTVAVPLILPMISAEALKQGAIRERRIDSLVRRTLGYVLEVGKNVGTY